MKQTLWTAADRARNWVRWHRPGMPGRLETQARFDEISVRLGEINWAITRVASAVETLCAAQGSPPSAAPLRPVR